MRLAIVRQRYNPFGGAERFVERAMSGLAAQGVQLTLVTRRWPEAPVRTFEPLVVDPFYLGRLWRDVGFAQAACRALAGARADLVQSHERLACCDIYRAGDGVHREWLDQRRADAGLLTRLRIGLNPYHHYVLAAERRMFASPRLAAVICNSRMVREEIRRHFGVPDSKLHVVHTGVDLGEFSPEVRSSRSAIRAQLGIAPFAYTLLLVGSGYERKGVASAIAALVPNPRATLIIVGNDRRPAHYSALARSLGVGERVRFVGPVKDPRPYYGAADVFVLPTLYDPLPNAALEALACGLPVITSTKCGAAEIVHEAGCGLIAPANDAKMLAAHVARLSDPDVAAIFSQRARSAALGLSTESMVTTLTALYFRLLEARAGRDTGREAEPGPL